jgi:hypothetical protein
LTKNRDNEEAEFIASRQGSRSFSGVLNKKEDRMIAKHLASILAVTAFMVVSIFPVSGATRQEVPISQALGANGRYYYFVSVTVGGSQPFNALLDSGSTGLRLLPGIVGNSDVTSTSRHSTYGYGTGSQFDGVIARGVVSLGSAKTAEPVAVMLIDKVGCADARGSCPAAGHTAQDFSFATEAGMAEPNKARIGIGLGPSDADNPLAKIGDGIWIVELPSPGETMPGRLILNPAADEIAGFTKLQVSAETGELGGCVIRVSDSQKICGQVLPDTGGNGMIVEARQRPESFPWPDGTQAVLGVVDEQGEKFGIGFAVKHVPGDSQNLHWQQSGRMQPRISGSLPFLGFSVLFDSAHHEIGFRQR